MDSGLNQPQQLRMLATSAALLDAAAASGATALQAQLPASETTRWSLRWFGQSTHWQAALLQGMQPRQRRQAWLCLHDRLDPARTLEQWLAWLQGDEAGSSLVPWPYGRLDPAAHVSRHYLAVMRQFDDLGDGRLRLIEALLALSDCEELVVAGHGRAGALASVAAPWLETQLGRRGRLRLQVHSFGAPTAGDWVFAEGLESSYGMASGRCLSRLDPLPYCWGGLGWLVNGVAGGARLPPRLKAQFQRLAERLAKAPRPFTQPPGGWVLDALHLANTRDLLTSIAEPAGGGSLAASDEDPDGWLQQAQREHDLASYRRRLSRLLASSQNDPRTPLVSIV